MRSLSLSDQGLRPLRSERPWRTRTSLNQTCSENRVVAVAAVVGTGFRRLMASCNLTTAWMTRSNCSGFRNHLARSSGKSSGCCSYCIDSEHHRTDGGRACFAADRNCCSSFRVSRFGVAAAAVEQISCP